MKMKLFILKKEKTKIENKWLKGKGNDKLYWKKIILKSKDAWKEKKKSCINK